jgi:hypothetical protein
MLTGLNQKKLVPPEIISDRYVAYRVSEYLLAFIDYKKRSQKQCLLPFEKKPFITYFPISKIYINNQQDRYIISNLAKGGVIKIFNKKSRNTELNDCGIIGKLKDGRTITTQWIDPNLHISIQKNQWMVKGHFHIVKSNKLFSPLKMICFRIVLLLIGWNPYLAHRLKGIIRQLLIMGQKPLPIIFKRTMLMNESEIEIQNEIKINKSLEFQKLAIGDEFFTRYVPQSRYFQSQELDMNKYPLQDSLLDELNKNKKITITQKIKTLKRD